MALVGHVENHIKQHGCADEFLLICRFPAQSDQGLRKNWLERILDSLDLRFSLISEHYLLENADEFANLACEKLEVLHGSLV